MQRLTFDRWRLAQRQAHHSKRLDTSCLGKEPRERLSLTESRVHDPEIRDSQHREGPCFVVSCTSYLSFSGVYHACLHVQEDLIMCSRCPTRIRELRLLTMSSHIHLTTSTCLPGDCALPPIWDGVPFSFQICPDRASLPSSGIWTHIPRSLEINQPHAVPSQPGANVSGFKVRVNDSGLVQGSICLKDRRTVHNQREIRGGMRGLGRWRKWVSRKGGDLGGRTVRHTASPMGYLANRLPAPCQHPQAPS